MIHVLKNNATRAINAITMLKVILIISLFVLVSDIMEFNFLSELSEYDPSYDSDTELIASANANDDRQQMVAGIYLIALLITGILFIQWFRRAYYNLNQVKAMRYSEGWAAGAWFVPFLNFIRPLQIMQDMHEEMKKSLGSRYRKIVSNESLVGLWWFMFMGGNFIGYFSAKQSIAADTISDYQLMSSLALIEDIMTIISCYIAIRMVREFSQLEGVWAETINDESHGTLEGIENDGI